ncbi:MAG TPA: cysteine desulfurase family protein [Hypericibacter adhaerens]|jgi:cysteine desulfurase|uniref:Cysteine desulfurase n=1 Tax=Hypericibacter adhaerens TaxID=2602016 RepID=A0A5J6MVQ9_9PROT|nr:cysteine desulfurase family protein [Hypericibacter adhaerens]QEX21529.1 cysteine desulfurase [Hypericibacter adhaerens]HWA45565.1 cysteine desulfurase family protein [Hypericibacter adhaerens]
MTRQIYMDYNATAPMRPRAIEAVAAGLAQAGNPSSVHRFGRLARRAVEAARETLAGAVGARPAEILFVSGGSEANNLALKGAGRARVLASAVEHDSVLAAAAVERIPVDREGIVDLTALERMLNMDSRPALVSVMLANNETGAIQPVAEVARIAHARGALVHCDAVQAFGRIVLDLPALDVDFASLSAHKLGGPTGIGALYMRDGLALTAQIAGGGQERGQRAGTPNLPGIVGFGVVAQQANADIEDMRRIRELRDRLESGVRRLQPSVRIFAENAERLPNTSCFAVAGLDSETQVIALDLAGIAVSAGAACSSGRVQASHVLRAMGADPVLAGSAIRVSLGWQSEERDIDEFLTAWRALLARHAGAAQTETAA